MYLSGRFYVWVGHGNSTPRNSWNLPWIYFYIIVTWESWNLPWIYFYMIVTWESWNLPWIYFYMIVTWDSWNLPWIYFYMIQYTASVSTIILSGPTYSSQNVRQIWESTLSKSDYLVGHRGLGRTSEWIFKDFFLHFSRWICQTFYDRCVFVSVLSFRCVECVGT
jgi:hypothetical protein